MAHPVDSRTVSANNKPKLNIIIKDLSDMPWTELESYHMRC